MMKKKRYNRYGVNQRKVALLIIVALVTTSLPVSGVQAGNRETEKVSVRTEQPVKMKQKDKGNTGTDKKQQKAGKGRTELKKERTENSTTYQLENGSKETEFYAEDVRYVEEKTGKLTDYDASLKTIETQKDSMGNSLKDYCYENKQGQEKNYLPKVLEEDTPVLTENGNYQAAILPEINGQAEKIKNREEDFSGKDRNTALAQEEVEYAGEACPEKDTMENLYGKEKTAITGVSYQTEKNLRYYYESKNQGIKENIILEREPESNIFQFRLTLTDAFLAAEMEKKEEVGKEKGRKERDAKKEKNQRYQNITEERKTAQGENLCIQDEKNNCIGIIPAGNVNDATGNNYSEECIYSVKHIDTEKDGKVIKNSYRISLIVEGDYLKKNSTVYPVTIDPSCYWQSGNTERSQCNVSDTYVRSGSYSTTNFGNSRYFLAGRDKDGSIERSFIKFNNLTQDIKGKYIENASLELREYGNSTKDLNIHVKRVTSSWYSSGICYGKQPELDSTIIGNICSSGVPGRLHYTNITGYVVGVLSGKYADNGIGLVSATEGSSTKAYGAFFSADSEWGPKLTVTYQEAPTAPENVTLNKTHIREGDTAKISWSGIISPSISRYEYRLVYCGNGNKDILQVQKAAPLKQNSAGNYYITVKNCSDVAFPEGNYAVYLRGVDSQGNIGKEGKAYIYLDNTPPAKAKLTLVGTDQENYHCTMPVIQWNGATDNVGIKSLVFSFNGCYVTTGSSKASGTYTFRPNGGIRTGENKIVMYETDEAGNLTTTDAIMYYYDGQPPELTVGGITPATTKEQPSTQSPKVNYVAKDNIELGELQYSLDGVHYSGLNIGSSGSVSIPPECFAGSGAYTLYLRLTDKAGNMGPVYTYPYYFKDLSQECRPKYVTARENMDGSTTITWEKKYTDSLPTGASYSLYGSKDKGFTPGETNLIQSGIRTNSYTLSKDNHKDIRYYKLCVVRMQDGKEVNRRYTREINSIPVEQKEIDKKVGECNYSGSEGISLPGGNASIRKDSGNLTYTAEGLILPALHFSIPITPVYNSSRDYEGILGKSWMLSQEKQLWQEDNGYYYLDETGAIHKFTDRGNGSTSPSVIGMTIMEQTGHFKTKTGEKSIDYQFVVKNSEGVEYYSKEGRLVAEVEKNGAYLLYRYNENDGTLSEIITTTGRKARFHYDEKARELGKNRLLSVTYSNNEGKVCAETISFTYQEEMLSGIIHTGTDGKSTLVYTYGYEDGSLCMITSPEGKKANIIYKDGKVQRVSSIQGEMTEFSYEVNSTCITHSDETGMLTSTTTTSFDKEGRVAEEINSQGLATTYVYGTGINFYQTVKVTTESEYQVLTSEGKVEIKKATKTTESNYNDSGILSKEIDENGGVATYEYQDSDNFDQPTQIMEISGEGSNTTETMTYDGRGNLLTDKTVEEGGETTVTQNKYSEVTGEEEEGYIDDDIIEETESSTTLQEQESSVSSTEYDKEGNVTRETVLSGTTEETTTTKYDDMGRVVSEENDAQGTKTSYVYDVFGRTIQTTITYTKGEQKGTTETEAKTYDADGNILTETAKDGTITTYCYDEKNRIITETINKGEKRTRHYTYSTEDIVLYGGQGIQKTIPVSVKTVKDQEGVITDITYTDGEGRTVRSYSGGIYTDTWYDKSGHALAVCVLGTILPESSSGDKVLKNSRVSLELYDEDGNVTHSIVNPMIREASYYRGEESLQTVREYDKDGNIISQKDAMDNTTKYIYNGGQLARVKKADGTEGNTYQYSQIYTGDTVKISDATGTEGTEQKPLADVTINSRGKTSRTITNAAGQILAVEDEAEGKKIATCYTYDETGNKTKEIYGTGRYLTFQYDGKGQVIKEKAYDEKNNQTGEVSYTYDYNGNVTKMVDYEVKEGKKTALRTTLSEYDYFQRLTAYAEIDGTDSPSESQKQANQVTYAYDTSDRIVGITYQEKEGISGMKYQYNAYGWLTQVIGNRVDGEEVILRKYAYDSHGKVSSIVDTVDYLKDGEHTLHKSYTYDIYDRATGITVTDEKNEKVMKYYSYTYDKNGNITRKEEKSSYGANGTDRVIQYQYNKLGELVEGTRKDYKVDSTAEEEKESRNISSSNTITYTYDGTGNRTGVTMNDNTITYTYNGLDQLTKVVSSGERKETKTYTYDGAGNQTQLITTDTSNVESRLTENYTYDSKNQLKKVTKDTGNGEQTIQENWYNGNGQRIRKTEGGRTINYYYQNGSVLKTTDAVGTLQARYLYGAESNPFGVIDGSGVAESGETAEDGTGIVGDSGVPVSECVGMVSYLYTKDIQGSIIDLVDEEGVGVTSYTYDDYGTTSITGKQDTANELAYAGGVYDKITETYYLNARYYHPEDGRFFSMDTYRGENTEYNTWNLYGYCGGNPVNYVDPSGHKKAKTTPVFTGPLYSMKAGKKQAKLFWNMVIKLYLLQYKGWKLSAKLLEHSLQDKPNDMKFGNNSSMVKTIKKSSEFRKKIKSMVTKKRFGISAGSGLQFKKGDLFGALHNTNIWIDGSKIGGKWNLKGRITDYYDFKMEEIKKKGFITIMGNNVACIHQYMEIIHGYSIIINFKVTVNNLGKVLR